MFPNKRLRGAVSTIAATGLIATALPLQALAADYSAKELRALGLSSDWRDGRSVITKGPDGKVIYLYGQVQPTVVCAPLQVCDIELQPGEVVRNVMVGDTVRWKVDPATSGGPNGNTVHLIIKPTEPGLVTSMVVTTSRRTYQIKLRSDDHRYMARVGFDYPEDIQAKFEAANRQLEANIIPGAGVPAENLDFNFHLQGQARWRPTRVYSDGTKTYIQFPSGMAAGDAPVLYVTSGGENQIVNYRLKGHLMIVDYMIDKAVLMSGVGSRQRKVRIAKGG
ncbi:MULTISPECIES: P-type conjugative transfer protein TrbG [unclassified Roseibium]|uniref:P-type conjugative transfer protein TrbG n=1 Tax=unclassified Roseibium TaxID=2629323 RepID=UPI00273F1CC6|nr:MULTISPECIES: P-type conjugative transfer protein TrbG [unclassified Roseibium]